MNVTLKDHSPVLPVTPHLKTVAPYIPSFIVYGESNNYFMVAGGKVSFLGIVGSLLLACY